MLSKEFFLALEALEKEKGISQEQFIEMLSSAIAAARKKQTGDISNIEIKLFQKRRQLDFTAQNLL